jgi:hypothetical protein
MNPAEARELASIERLTGKPFNKMPAVRMHARNARGAVRIVLLGRPSGRSRRLVLYKRAS